MGEIHSQGKVYPTRLGQEKVLHSIPIAVVPSTSNLTLAAGVLALTVEAIEKPTIAEFQVVVQTAFNAGTTNVLVVGTTSGGNDIFGSSDITEGTPGFYPANGTVKQVLITADTPIYFTYTFTGTNPTTGVAYLLVNVFGLETIDASAT